VPELESYIRSEKSINHSIPFLALTETWLKSYMSDAQLHIPGYVVSRSDRAKRVGGGVLLYSHSNIPVTRCMAFDDNVCEALFCEFDTIKTCIAVVYRPPSASYSSFSAVLNFLDSCISNVADAGFNCQIMGDFNLPTINWANGIIGSTTSMASATALLSFIDRHFMNQHVMCPTRGSNILDLFITDNDRLVSGVNVKETPLSDHGMVDILLSWNPLSLESSAIPTFDENNFRSLDFNKVNLSGLRSDLGDVDWNALRVSTSFEDFPKLFTDTVFQVCKRHVPLKKPATGGPRHGNALRRKKKRLQGRLDALIEHEANPEHISNVRSQLALVHYEIKEAHCKYRDMKENLALSKIKSNPKYFYSYAKQLSKVRSSISMLLDKNGLIKTDSKDMADILQEQFSSVFSDPAAVDVKDPCYDVPDIKHPLLDHDIVLCEEDVLKAIQQIPSSSACGPDGIPVALLKDCCNELVIPIMMIWSESMDSGVVPKFYKEALISPLYKKGIEPWLQTTVLWH